MHPITGWYAKKNKTEKNKKKFGGWVVTRIEGKSISNSENG